MFDPVKKARSLLASIAIVIALASTSLFAGPEIGEPAPDFTLKSNTGTNYRLAELKGKVILLNFWATWCSPCLEELPELEKLYQKYQQGDLLVLAASIDTNTEEALAFARQVQASYPILFDSKQRVSALYDIETMPSTFLIDRDGVLRFKHRGYNDSYIAKYEVEIRELIRE